jgi:hypothetical protein
MFIFLDASSECTLVCNQLSTFCCSVELQLQGDVMVYTTVAHGCTSSVAGGNNSDLKIYGQGQSSMSMHAYSQIA